MSDLNPSDGNTNAHTAPPKSSRIDLDSSLIAWMPTQRGGRGSAADVAANRHKIRAQASRASANLRKATIATKMQRKAQHITTPSSSSSPTPGDGRQEALLQAQRLHEALKQSGIDDSTVPRHVDFQVFVSVVDALESQQHWLTRALRETTMAQTSIRGDMRDAFTLSPALFQATLFIAGTFSNTCGLSYSQVGTGVGMAFMRGASLDAVRSAITAQQGEHWVSMAVALLAGWELRFGDRDSYDIHMTAYRTLFGAPLDLKENSTAMMRDFAFESLREQLNGLVISTPLRTSKPSAFWRIQPGFDVFGPVIAPEVKSLLSIVRDTANFDPRPLSSLQIIRNQGLVSDFLLTLVFPLIQWSTQDTLLTSTLRVGQKAMAWTPHHGETIEPSSTFEGQWDPFELNALLHVRAAILSIIALHSSICHAMHRATTYIDIMGAADLHAHSCGHLRTDALIGTKYQDVAIWARVSLAAISRDPSRDNLFNNWLTVTHLDTWKSLRAVMEAHLLQDEFFPQTQGFFNAVLCD